MVLSNEKFITLISELLKIIEKSDIEKIKDEIESLEKIFVTEKNLLTIHSYLYYLYTTKTAKPYDFLCQVYMDHKLVISDLAQKLSYDKKE